MAYFDPDFYASGKAAFFCLDVSPPLLCLLVLEVSPCSQGPAGQPAAPQEGWSRGPEVTRLLDEDLAR